VTMQGAYNAKKFVNDYLEDDIPGRLLQYRNEWNLDDENLPEPQRYLVYEPVAIDRWPMLITVAISMSGLSRSDLTHGLDPKYFVEYQMRTYVWVKDDDHEQCTAKRDRLTTVLRSSLLDDPCLNLYAQPNHLEAYIDESTIREEYSDLTLLKGERVMAGAYLSYNLRLTEVITVDPIASSLDEIDTEVNPLAPLLGDF
jgi:hypothetical protein